MKKTLILATLLLTTLISQATILIVKSGGGPNGYRDVVEVHGNGNHEITCKQPGYEKCVWNIKPSAVINESNGNTCDVSVDYCESLVESEISSGNLSGTLTESNGIKISWNGEDLYNVTISITCVN